MTRQTTVLIPLQQVTSRGNGQAGRDIAAAVTRRDSAIGESESLCFFFATITVIADPRLNDFPQTCLYQSGPSASFVAKLDSRAV